MSRDRQHTPARVSALGARGHPQGPAPASAHAPRGGEEVAAAGPDQHIVHLISRAAVAQEASHGDAASRRQVCRCVPASRGRPRLSGQSQAREIAPLQAGQAGPGSSQDPLWRKTLYKRPPPAPRGRGRALTPYSGFHCLPSLILRGPPPFTPSPYPSALGAVCHPVGEGRETGEGLAPRNLHISTCDSIKRSDNRCLGRELGDRPGIFLPHSLTSPLCRVGWCRCLSIRGDLAEGGGLPPAATSNPYCSWGLGEAEAGSLELHPGLSRPRQHPGPCCSQGAVSREGAGSSVQRLRVRPVP